MALIYSWIKSYNSLGESILSMSFYLFVSLNYANETYYFETVLSYSNASRNYFHEINWVS